MGVFDPPAKSELFFFRSLGLYEYVSAAVLSFAAQVKHCDAGGKMDVSVTPPQLF